MPTAHPPPRSRFTFADLFAGIGGTRLGVEAVGGECVFTCESDRFARKTYAANFASDTHEIAGDITALRAETVPRHDLLVAGFPCQPFSLAGVSKKNSLGRPHGFDCDSQGTLFFEIARLLDHCRPQAFILENVRNLLSHDRGATFEKVRRVLEDDLGYRTATRVLDARPWVPQHRPRVFIVGLAGGDGFSFDGLSPPSAAPRLRDVLHPADGSEPAEPPYTAGKAARVSPKYTLSDSLWRFLRDHADKHRAKGNGFGFGLVGPDDTARTLSARYHKDGSEILIRRRRGNPRRLTPRECARLMGFPDDFVIPVSDTQAYRQFGNSVVVPVVEAVARQVVPHLGTTQRRRARRLAA
ncbi:MAG TPA: DNA (cytosine-5-)-methyltransferase [Acidimicrobiaceae bacterium]|nr:DNA (cytosine-5-)-methyltransferase [Acidimicrobiaceae bacterium]HCB37189.1 DNA (cytosine-5-)-methyltransferase [Acidimicrobiaceae bacterium]